jgi:hypothetical protein
MRISHAKSPSDHNFAHFRPVDSKNEPTTLQTHLKTPGKHCASKIVPTGSPFIPKTISSPFFLEEQNHSTVDADTNRTTNSAPLPLPASFPPPSDSDSIVAFENIANMDNKDDLFSSSSENDSIPSHFQQMSPPSPNVDNIDLTALQCLFNDQSHVNSSNPLPILNAILDDTTHGPLLLRDYPACIDISNDIAHFCIAALQAHHHIGDLTNHHLDFLTPRLDEIFDEKHRPDEDSARERYLKAISFVLNCTSTKLLDAVATDRLQDLPYPLPSTFAELHQCDKLSFGHECALTILYGLKTRYTLTFRNFAHPTLEPTLQANDLANIARDLMSFATASSLFPRTTDFRSCPFFVRMLFDRIHFFPNPYDFDHDFRRPNTIRYRSGDVSSALNTAIRKITRTTDLINSYGDENTVSDYASTSGRNLLRQALNHHFLLYFRIKVHQKVQNVKFYFTW